MVKVFIQSTNKYPKDQKTIKKSITETLIKNRVGGNIEISVAIVGEVQMDLLSKKYLKDDLAHEVLSFPLEESESPDGVLRLGDIILCWPQVVLAAKRDGVKVEDEVYKLTAHSMEHLLGKHHE
ncbi:MAG: rRNA maturation RNase YbeY [Candidatus Curtissbacteria bacterium]|nr:rRNA maturation RNase YbeY [Candidatus Curtissbacteria bacterium]